jgi:hypothetical protein
MLKSLEECLFGCIARPLALGALLFSLQTARAEQQVQPKKPIGIEHLVEDKNTYRLILPFKAPETDQEKTVLEEFGVVGYMNFVRVRLDLKMTKKLAEVVNSSDFDAALEYWDLLKQSSKVAGFVPLSDINVFQWSRTYYKQTKDPNQQEPKVKVFQMGPAGELYPVDTTIAPDVFKSKPNTPEGVAKAFFEAYSQGDIESILNYSIFPEKFRQVFENLGYETVSAKLKSHNLKMSQVIRVVDGKERVYRKLNHDPNPGLDDLADSDFARVDIRGSKEDEELTFYIGLVKVKQEWKVFGFEDTEAYENYRTAMLSSKNGEDLVSAGVLQPPELKGSYFLTVSKPDRQGVYEFEFLKQLKNKRIVPMMRLNGTKEQLRQKMQAFKQSDYLVIESVYGNLMGSWFEGDIRYRRSEDLE